MTETPDQPDPPHTTLPAFTPIPRRGNRGDVWTAEVQRGFIEALADTASVEAACRLVGRSPASAYRLRRHPLAGGFAAAWQAAIDFGMERVEDYAVDRAVNGVEVPVFILGGEVIKRRIYSDKLVMFMLRSRKPERYCAGGARSLSAIDTRTLARLKTQWRAEWEAEREAAAPSPAEIRKSIERKVAALRAQVVARTSPRAFELELAVKAQVEADEAAGWRPGFPYAEFAEKAAELLPKFVEQVRAEYPPYAEVQWCDADRREHGAPALLAGPRERGEEEQRPSPASDPAADPPVGPRIRTIKGEWD